MCASVGGGREVHVQQVPLLEQLLIERLCMHYVLEEPSFAMVSRIQLIVIHLSQATYRCMCFKERFAFHTGFHDQFHLQMTTVTGDDINFVHVRLGETHRVLKATLLPVWAQGVRVSAGGHFEELINTVHAMLIQGVSKNILIQMSMVNTHRVCIPQPND
jgi:hypothetical protein